jgi:hypothetical protein
MSQNDSRQLISYIALGAPATRRPSTGDEPYLRPEVGFTPKWFREAIGADFGEQWHRDPAFRRDSIVEMAKEVRRRFGDSPIGVWQAPDQPRDLLTGVFGASLVAAIYGISIGYSADNWPWSLHEALSGEQVAQLEPPDLDSSPIFQELMEQVEWIAGVNGKVEGFINWQGVLNNAYRVRGQDLFVDMLLEPARVHHLMECVTETMIEGARKLYERQRNSGVEVQHFTVSNCLVNMVSPDQYREFIFPCDKKISEVFGLLGVHNCAWNANPYIEHYSQLPDVGYVDMGLESDLVRAHDAFPKTRRALMYTPMDVANKSLEEIDSDLEQIAADYGPCDVVFADIEDGTPDERVLHLFKTCERISKCQ